MTSDDKLPCGHSAYLYAVPTAEGTYCWQCQHDEELIKPIPARVHSLLFLWYVNYRVREGAHPDNDTFYEQSKQIIDEAFGKSLP